MKFLFIFFIPFLLEAKELTRTQVIMATYVTITSSDIKHISNGFNIMRDVELSLSSYDENAKIATLNRELSVELDDYSYEALLLSKRYYEESNGYFDITIGSITKELYNFGSNKERVPTQKELNEAKVDFLGIKFDKNEAFLDKGVKIDLGGMGKGYGVDKVAEYFRKNRVYDAVIAASGDIRCLSKCSIDIQDPFNEEGHIASFKTKKDDMGISTSGNYNRYVIDTANNHLIDPKTKKPQLSFVSITLVADMQNSDLDAYATAASVMSIKKAYEFLDKIGVGYIVLQSDRALVVSQNISNFVQDLLFNKRGRQWHLQAAPNVL